MIRYLVNNLIFWFTLFFFITGILIAIGLYFSNNDPFFKDPIKIERQTGDGKIQWKIGD